MPTPLLSWPPELAIEDPLSLERDLVHEPAEAPERALGIEERAALDAIAPRLDTGPPGRRDLRAGTRLGDRYRLGWLAGRGGAAAVWRGHDELLDRDVAVKVPIPRPGRDLGEVRRRLLREAQLGSAIRHPNVVEVLDFGEHDERPFLVMPWLDGESLDARLAREGTMEPSAAISLAAGLLEGLQAAHRAGVVHRDLKPSNIYLVRDGDHAVPTLLDFGVSRSLDPNRRRSALTTAAGQLVGTPEYMSPEQARGAPDLDHRSDLYSAALVLHECLTGALPYASATVGELLVELVTREHGPLPSVRAELGPVAEVLTRALASDPRARFRSAREMRTALLAAHASLFGARALFTPARRASARRIRHPRAIPGPSSTAPTPTFVRAPAAGREGPAHLSALERPPGETPPARRETARLLARIALGVALVGSALALSSWVVVSASSARSRSEARAEFRAAPPAARGGDCGGTSPAERTCMPERSTR